jgi:hypothetical protein
MTLWFYMSLRGGVTPCGTTTKQSRVLGSTPEGDEIASPPRPVGNGLAMTLRFYMSLRGGVTPCGTTTKQSRVLGSPPGTMGLLRLPDPSGMARNDIVVLHVLARNPDLSGMSRNDIVILHVFARRSPSGTGRTTTKQSGGGD